jgi:hypothetical protein
MKISRPSPSLVVSIAALVVACAGTATAAGVLITNSSQVKVGAINGSDIKNRSLTGIDIADGTISARQLKKSVGSSLSASSVGSATGLTATEAVRKAGPENQAPGQHVVATLAQLQPGSYLILGKSTVSTDVSNQGLLYELLKPAKTINSECVLASGGDQDNGRAGIASPGSQSSPATINVQMTRTIDKPTDVTLTCSANDVNWRASDTSIVAVKLTSSTRSDVTG